MKPNSLSYKHGIFGRQPIVIISDDTKPTPILTIKIQKFTCARENPIQKLKKLFTYSSTARDNNFIKLKYQDTEKYQKNKNKVFNYISRLQKDINQNTNKINRSKA